MANLTIPIKKKPMLSIYITTYNHENYIKEALDSVLLQETKYSFEVLIGEDCSTDNTRSILKDYELRYPGFFAVYYRDHNMWNDEVRNSTDLIRRCTGKYLIALEGDDFWTDPFKIEKQITFLENHPEYYAVAHNCTVVGKDSIPNGELYPECKEKEYTYRHFFHNIMPGQLTTVMYRNPRFDSNFDDEWPGGITPPGDRILFYKLLCNGRIYCIQESMSAYRHVVDEGDSYSAKYTYSFEKRVQWLQAMIDYTSKNRAEWLVFVKILYYRNLCRGLKYKQCSVQRFFALKREAHLYGLFPALLYQYVSESLLSLS